MAIIAHVEQAAHRARRKERLTPSQQVHRPNQLGGL
jgi:hypothetical protein